MIPLRDDNPVRSRPVVTISIIVLCTLVFLWELTLSPRAERQAMYLLGFIPALLLGNATLEGPTWVPAPVTIVTAMFLHGGLLHLGGNMLYLWIFGDNVEDRLGRGRFIVFYLVCGTVAAIGQAVADPSSEVPMIGASGAISGVLGAYLVLYPRARVLVLLPLLIIFYTVRVPAVVVLGLWFAGQLLSSLAAPPGSGGGVAFAAHVGGFVAGVLTIRFFLRERRRRRG
ncbi:MAG TPA: rhomboid family intramembrane serine protease [Gammaproteobacteria bacterium]|jgi:membrane associated rhomboid family serine protease|nr:rhomboid family intramembrane serine protease [Gammaproteobacteria bacterium]